MLPRRSLRSHRDRAGFTILELLTVSGLISVLLGLLLPAISGARESARQVQCKNNLRQLGIALHSYHDFQGGLPPGWQPSSTGNPTAWGWATGLLPFLEQAPLRSHIQFAEPIDHAGNAFVRAQSLPLLLCPSDSAPKQFSLFREHGNHESGGQTSETVLVRLPSANYLGVFGTTDPDDVAGASGTGAFLQSRSIRFAELQRGLSHTFLVGERTARRLSSTWLGFHRGGEDAPGRVVGFVHQGVNRPDADECEFDSRHPGMAHFLFADGHVKSISESIDRRLYRSLATRAIGAF